MEAVPHDATLTSVLKNELDFLVFLGLSAGNILRYVRISGRLDDTLLAELLGTTPDVLRNLEKTNGRLPNDWHMNLRAFFDN